MGAAHEEEDSRKAGEATRREGAFAVDREKAGSRGVTDAAGDSKTLGIDSYGTIFLKAACPAHAISLSLLWCTSTS